MTGKSFIFDTATGQRVYRRLSGQVLARLKVRVVAQWTAELAGVALTAFGAWLVFEPGGFLLVGTYLVILANIDA